MLARRHWLHGVWDPAGRACAVNPSGELGAVATAHAGHQFLLHQHSSSAGTGSAPEQTVWLPERPPQDRLGDTGAALRSQRPLPAEARSQPEQVLNSTSKASVTG